MTLKPRNQSYSKRKVRQNHSNFKGKQNIIPEKNIFGGKIIYLIFLIVYTIKTKTKKPDFRQNFHRISTWKQISNDFILPRGIATTLQVSSDLGVRSDAIVESHHLGIIAKHWLVLHKHALHATVEHHITPHHLKNWKKTYYIEIITVYHFLCL